jgi:hypothetical protein
VPKNTVKLAAALTLTRHSEDAAAPARTLARARAPGTFGVLPATPLAGSDDVDATPDVLEALAFPQRSLTAARDLALAGAAPVTACLLSWKRLGNLEIIVNALRQLEFIDEILVWNNNPDVCLNFRDGKTRVIQSPDNQVCYGRFLCAAQARNSVIYVQDDDVLNHDVAGLYRQFLRDPTRITHALSEAHWEQRERYLHREAHVALLGWGAVFLKEWLSVFDDLSPVAREDPLFRREADKFFTILLQRQHHSVRGALTHLDGHAAGGALWREPQHEQLKAYAVSQGLRMLRLKQNPAPPAPWNVVITCHDYGAYLREAVDSVLANDVDYDIHIVDDCSGDDTPEVAAELIERHPHVHYLRNPQRRGAGYSRNRGIAAADSDFVVLLDADDRIGADYLFDAARLLREGADVVNPDAVLFGARRARWSVPEVTTLEMLLERNHVHCCSAFRRALWSQVGGIDEQMPCWMDYDFWIRVAATGARIWGLHGDYFFYHQHGDSLSSRAHALRAELRDYLLRKHAALLREAPG